MSSSSYLVRKPTLARQLEDEPQAPPAWPALTLVQVADHRLLLQKVIAQLLVQPKRQHVVRKRAGGTRP